MSARVLLADDHPLFLRGLHDALEAAAFEVVAESRDGLAALEAIRDHRPDVAIVDINMPELDGLEVMARASRGAHPPLFIVMTMYDDPAYVRHALGLGARGYLLKDHADLEVVRCLHSVLRGGRFVAKGISLKAAPAPAQALSSAEERILSLVADGHSSRSIAELLSLSRRTVDNHRAHIARKLGLKGSNALLRYALSGSGRDTSEE